VTHCDTGTLAFSIGARLDDRWKILPRVESEVRDVLDHRRRRYRRCEPRCC
jgi:hypothetical protein